MHLICDVNFRGPNYIEMDVDVSSSSVAASVVGLVQGYTKSLVVDMAIVLEGKVPEELPESLLGTVRCAHLDLHSAKYLNTETGAQCSHICQRASPAGHDFHVFPNLPIVNQGQRGSILEGKR